MKRKAAFISAHYPTAVLLLYILCISSISCKMAATNADTKKISYLYTDHDSQGNALDSLKCYCERPWEESLELYLDTNTFNKTIEMMVHFEIFKLEGEKFAVITADETSFYKFDTGHYTKLFSSPVGIGFRVPPIVQKDYNNDGYTDLLYSVPSGGPYGDDNFLLFFNPKTKSLIYNPEPGLNNAEVNGNVVTTGGRLWERAYTINGFKLNLLREEFVIQTDTAYLRKEVITYDAGGKETTRDTVPIPNE